MRGIAVSWIIVALAAAGHGAVNAAPRQQDTAPAKEEGKTRYYFENDPRLNAKMTIQSRAYLHLRLWQEIMRRTRVPIDREQGASEFDDVPVVLACYRVSARAIMDAVAARVMARWERMEKEGPRLQDGYRFLLTQWETDRVFAPKSEQERERFRVGAEFLRILHTLPAATQGKLLQEPVPFTSLPDGMQRAVAEMLESLSKERQEGRRGTTIQPHQLSEALLRLERKPAHGFSRYLFTVTIPNVGSTGWRINDYEEREAERRRKQKARELDDLYTPRKFEVSREEARRLPALKRVVELNARNITFPEVLLRLHERYGIPFVCDQEKEMPQRADVLLPPMTLGEALDRLTEIYADTEWEWRKHGFLVVRDPMNFARDRKPPVGESSARPSSEQIGGRERVP